MKSKKSSGASLENKRHLFFLLGLCLSLSVVLFAFEWKTAPVSTMDLGELAVAETDFYFVPPTAAENKTPPKPKVEVPSFILVDNKSDIDENVDIFNSDPGEDVLFNPDDFVFQTKKTVKDDVEEIFVFVEFMPEFPGGDQALLKFLAKEVKYPVVAQENGIEGRVFVSFVIDETGSITDIHVIRGVDPALDSEALRVIRNMPKWKPGKQGGKTVKVRYNVPISFELQ